MDERLLLARQQSQILSALRAGTTPEGFSASQLAGAARSLFLKRQREAALAAPLLATALGGSFDECFAAFAAACDYPQGGPVADAAAFGRFLLDQKKLPRPAVSQWLNLRCRSGRAIQFHLVAKSLYLTVRVGHRFWLWRLFGPAL